MNGVTIVPALLDDIAVSPSPYHAVARVATLLEANDFAPVRLTEPMPTDGGRFFVCEGGALVAWIQGDRPAAAFSLVGAHTDSPNLRVRATADVESAGWAQVGMEIYGGVLLNSWLDRDLGLAGRVSVQVGDGEVEQRLLLDDRPLLRIPQLAIHLDRTIREKGLKLDPQLHMTPLWAVGGDGPGAVNRFVADAVGAEPTDILSWDLMPFDVQLPAIVGRDEDLIASARIDNLVSTFCGAHALAAGADAIDLDAGTVPVLALYDHEEIGSESATGAAGAFVSALLERISAATGVERADHLRALANSFVVSADGAHATHPNYADKHEPSHHIAVNAGIVVKRNANQRYATDATSEGRFRALCAESGVPIQTYIHRNDLPCGSTIGPITAGQLAVPTVDVGVPQLAMHSIRELCGTADVDHLVTALQAVWTH